MTQHIRTDRHETDLDQTDLDRTDDAGPGPTSASTPAVAPSGRHHRSPNIVPVVVDKARYPGELPRGITSAEQVVRRFMPDRHRPWEPGVVFGNPAEPLPRPHQRQPAAAEARYLAHVEVIDSPSDEQPADGGLARLTARGASS